ncbi:muscle M-line assembly protein unc-89-like [Colossoma macropomum]|uniref:muscle M-line assembly protein unc-89-like n=1 Tax=Colossoma macropomum TaxID=42526 RepID=UPI0018644692|nr:muscle M-line assembly protein unc-89-like [Colossoma macropomum]
MAGNKTVDTKKLDTVFAESRVDTPSVSSRLKAFRRQFHTVRAAAGDTVHLHCRLSPEISAAAREIRWFKGTDCIEVFQVTVGSGCEGSVKLTLRDVKVADSGQYRCEMLGEKKEEISVIHLHVSEFKLVSRLEDVGKLSDVEPLKPTSKKQSSPDFGPHAFCGHDVTLPCYLSPETSAVAMEIRWFKGTDCIYLYQNGQVTEGRGYEGRVSMTDELQRGNVSLSLRDVQWSDYGEYWCEVTHGGQRVKNDGVQIKVPSLPILLHFMDCFCDPTHPLHSFFSLLPSGRRLRSLRARTSRLGDSFIHQASNGVKPLANAEALDIHHFCL